jgi:hypothetical protein
MNTPSVARAAIVLPLRKRRKMLRRPSGRRRIVIALLVALSAGIGINFATRPRLSGRADLPPLEANPALEGWSDSAGRTALRSRRLDRIASGCATAPLQRREAVLDSFPDWADDVLGLVACRRVRPGFTADQLRAAWGPPARIIPDMTGIRPMEQWDYGHRSVLIWDGRIKSWQ